MSKSELSAPSGGKLRSTSPLPSLSPNAHSPGPSPSGSPVKSTPPMTADASTDWSRRAGTVARTRSPALEPSSTAGGGGGGGSAANKSHHNHSYSAGGVPTHQNKPKFVTFTHPSQSALAPSRPAPPRIMTLTPVSSLPPTTPTVLGPIVGAGSGGGGGGLPKSTAIKTRSKSDSLNSVLVAAGGAGTGHKHSSPTSAAAAPTLLRPVITHSHPSHHPNHHTPQTYHTAGGGGAGPASPPDVHTRNTPNGSSPPASSTLPPPHSPPTPSTPLPPPALSSAASAFGGTSPFTAVTDIFENRIALTAALRFAIPRFGFGNELYSLVTSYACSAVMLVLSFASSGTEAAMNIYDIATHSKQSVTAIVLTPQTNQKRTNSATAAAAATADPDSGGGGVARCTDFMIGSRAGCCDGTVFSFDRMSGTESLDLTGLNGGARGVWKPLPSLAIPRIRAPICWVGSSSQSFYLFGGLSDVDSSGAGAGSEMFGFD